MTDFYDANNIPSQGAPGSSSVIRGEFSAIASEISAKLPPLTGNGLQIVRVNTGGTALESVTSASLAALLVPDLFLVNDATDSGVSSPVSLIHTTSGTPANGIGTGLEFITEATAGNEIGSVIESVCTDVTAASEDFDLVFNLMVAGATAAEKLRLKSTGELNLATGGFLAVNGTSVLSATTLGGAVLASSLTSLGTIASLVTTTADINGGTIDGVNIGVSVASPQIWATSLLAGSVAATTITTTGAFVGPGGLLWDASGINLDTGDTFKINGVTILSAVALATSVLASSLTSVGTIGTGVWQGTVIAETYLPNASLTAEGVVELATQAEVTTGTDANRVVTCSTLEGKAIDAASVDGKSISVRTQASYDGITPDADTLYFIVG